MTLLDEKLLERPLLGRHLVWWLATLGVVLTASRAFIDEEPVGYDPERAMQEVVAHTHYLPRHWRGRAHTAEVQAAFNQLFQYKILLFLEELASVVLTPFMLYLTLPQCAGRPRALGATVCCPLVPAEAITCFVADFTVHVEGVGDVCSFAAFDLQAHGNVKYGAPATLGGPLPKAARTRQGKLEKSLLTFVATYPTWEPGPAGKAMLLALGHNPYASVSPFSPQPTMPSFPYPYAYPYALHTPPQGAPGAWDSPAPGSRPFTSASHFRGMQAGPGAFSPSTTSTVLSSQTLRQQGGGGREGGCEEGGQLGGADLAGRGLEPQPEHAECQRGCEDDGVETGQAAGSAALRLQHVQQQQQQQQDE
ncbi:hypothetical protein QJQ45_026663, partial [Haematococcus lacustris]